MKLKNLILIAGMGLALAGCQNGSTVDTNQSPANQNGKAVVDHGTPFSSGPTDAPSVKGPSAAPPTEVQTIVPSSTAPAAQAVTTNENIRLTLPLKTQK